MVKLRIGRRPSTHGMRVVLLGVTAAGLLVAGCGSSKGVSSANATTTTLPAATTAPAASTSGSATVDTTSSAKYGTILVDGSGRTLYMLTADTPKTSACTGACPPIWPPLLVTGPPHAGSGVNQSLLSTITRADGKHQVTYNGHPLYTFASDTAAGAVNGEGINHFGGIWYVLSPAGQPITGASSSDSSSPTTASSGYGY